MNAQLCRLRMSERRKFISSEYAPALKQQQQQQPNKSSTKHISFRMQLINKYGSLMFLQLLLAVVLVFLHQAAATTNEHSLQVLSQDREKASISFWLESEQKYFWIDLVRHSVVSPHNFTLSIDGTTTRKGFSRGNAFRALHYTTALTPEGTKTEHKGLVVVDLVPSSEENNLPSLSGFILQPEEAAGKRIELQLNVKPRPVEESMEKYSCGTHTSESRLPWEAVPFFSSGKISYSANENTFNINSNEKNPVFGHEGCPTSKKVLYVGTVADCSYVRTFKDGDVELVKAEIISNWNKTSAIYEKTFNVSLVLVQVIILKECSAGQKSPLSFNRPCSTDYTIEQRLSDFSHWRTSQNADASIWHLFTGCASGTVVGLAWYDKLGMQKAAKNAKGSWANGTCVTAKSTNLFAVIAHEIGHLLGAIHDCDSEGCSALSNETNDKKPKEMICDPCAGSCDCKAKYIMTPESAGKYLSEFSPQSIQRICHNMMFKSTFLKEPGSKPRIIEPVCGNGIKEEGEECDPGDGNDPCCGSDCKLKPGAMCSDLNDACCKQCKIIPKSQGEICFKADGPCQKDSYCDGVNASCPSVFIFENGSKCESKRHDPFDRNSPACASGMCTSKDIQCRSASHKLNEIAGSCAKWSTSCQMICSDGVQCLLMNMNFLDGTQCGKGGICSEGKCVGSSFTAYASDYWEVIVIVVMFNFLVLLGLIVLAVRRREERNEDRERQAPSVQM